MTAHSRARYDAACHAIQSGVKFEHEMLRSDDGSPKHLRVGVNLAQVSVAALAGLLIDRGLFTMDEYEAAMALAAEQEVERYHARAAAAGWPNVRFK